MQTKQQMLLSKIGELNVFISDLPWSDCQSHISDSEQCFSLLLVLITLPWLLEGARFDHAA